MPTSSLPRFALASFYAKIYSCLFFSFIKLNSALSIWSCSVYQSSVFSLLSFSRRTPIMSPSCRKNGNCFRSQLATLTSSVYLPFLPFLRSNWSLPSICFHSNWCVTNLASSMCSSSFSPYACRQNAFKAGNFGNLASPVNWNTCSCFSVYVLFSTSRLHSSRTVVLSSSYSGAGSSCTTMC